MLDPELFEYVERFLPEARADRLLRVLREQVPWEQREIRLFGKYIMQPRLMAWYADPGVEYSYSGLKLFARKMPEPIDRLRDDLADYCGVPFNSVLANAYRDGQDSMGWHSDDEKELGPQPVIASVSLGQVRHFLVRKKGASRSEKISLGHGSLLVMKGDSQHLYKHALPKSVRPMDWRINLTYRHIVS